MMKPNPKTLEVEQLLPTLLRMFPSFTRNMSKGDNGRIAIIGGDKKYTGAPYFAAMASYHSVNPDSYSITSYLIPH